MSIESVSLMVHKMALDGRFDVSSFLTLINSHTSRWNHQIFIIPFRRKLLLPLKQLVTQNPC